MKEQISKIRDKDSLTETQPQNLLGKTTEKKSPPKLVRVKESVSDERQGKGLARKTKSININLHKI